MTNIRWTRDAKPAQAPEFEKLQTVRDPLTPREIQSQGSLEYTNVVEEISNENIHKLLWETYFKDYFPEALEQWQMMENIDQNDFRLQDEELVEKAEYNDYIHKQIYFYKKSFEEHLKSFRDYLAENGNEKMAFLGRIGWDSENRAPIMDGSPNAEEVDNTRNSLWKYFLEKESDILTRSRTIYLWVLTHLLKVVQEMQEKALNASSVMSLYNKAQKSLSRSMGKLSFEKMYIESPPVNIMSPGPLFNNGVATYKIAIYKTYQSRLQQLGDEQRTMIDSSYSKYSQQQSFINEILQQLDGLLGEVSK